MKWYRSLGMVLAAVMLAILGSVALMCSLLPPPINFQQSTKSFYSSCLGNSCHVYFTSSVDAEGNYLKLFRLLKTAHPDQVITLHISGYGGDVQTVLHLANAVKQSKAEINTVVEGPSYSADAVIAMFGKHITIMPYALLMFHEPAMHMHGVNVTPEVACLSSKGSTDRGQDGYKKCLDGAKALHDMWEAMSKEYLYPYLTAQEIKDINNGHDVYISSEEMNKRLKKMNKN